MSLTVVIYIQEENKFYPLSSLLSHITPYPVLVSLTEGNQCNFTYDDALLSAVALPTHIHTNAHITFAQIEQWLS